MSRSARTAGSGAAERIAAWRDRVAWVGRQRDESLAEWTRRVRQRALPGLQSETLTISLAMGVGLVTGLLA